jgi:hypothetical protein
LSLRELEPLYANKRYLEILQPAAQVGEAVMDGALRRLLEDGEILAGKLHVTAIRRLLPEAAPAVTDVAVSEVALAIFDELLGGNAGGCVVPFECLTLSQHLYAEYHRDWEIRNYAFGPAPGHPFLTAVTDNCIKTQGDPALVESMMRGTPAPYEIGAPDSEYNRSWPIDAYSCREYRIGRDGHGAFSRGSI